MTLEPREPTRAEATRDSLCPGSHQADIWHPRVNIWVTKRVSSCFQMLALWSRDMDREVGKGPLTALALASGLLF